MTSDERAEFALAFLKLAEEALDPDEYNRLVSLFLEKQYRQHVRQLIPNVRDPRMIGAVCTEICRRSRIQPSEFKAMSRAEKIQAIEHVLQIGQLESQPTSTDPPADDDSELIQYVTLDQAAAMVSRSKRTLEDYLKKNKMPAPSVEGGGGKPHEWDWSALRPWLEKQFSRKLPREFPADRR